MKSKSVFFLAFIFSVLSCIANATVVKNDTLSVFAKPTLLKLNKNDGGFAE
jgi:hypothetical protein